MHTIERFKSVFPNISIVLVLPADQINFWKKSCITHLFNIKSILVKGGESRFHSVKNGLAVVPENSMVGIHDGVRPFVSKETLIRTYSAAENTGAAIPVIDVVESLRKIENTSSIAISREAYKIVQTPQCFKSELIKKAFEQKYSPLFTDDATVMEAAGYSISLVEGNRENIKITTPQDLKIAEYLIERL